jgi:hypothetical protein
VRAAAEGDAPFAAGSSWPHVRKVLEAVTADLEGGRDIGPLARGYGRTFAGDYLRRGTPLEAPLRSIGERIARLEGATRETQRATLAMLVAEVVRHEAQ